ncbi:MAG: histidine kinase [Saprospiraceae bacterium]
MSFVNTLLSGRGRLVTHLTGWGLAFGVFFLMLNGITGWKEALGRTTMNNCFLAVLFYFNAKVLVNRFLEKGKYKTWAALTIPFWIGMAGLRTWAELNLFGGTIFTHNRLPRDGGWMIFVVFLSVYFLMLVFSALYQFLENRYMLEIQNKELRARNTEAQLNFLKAQINPHFLFNTLNNIYAAASLQHPKTPDMVLRLSDLLRYVTYDGQSEKISLSREIDQVRAYLDLFELQAENPLQDRNPAKGN